ncbi:restriction endonuclease [Baekduia sp. Peel2402]|uniref:restriction endonuclease n=1 Tax=Baekduia sp. Peel2402 TaxID=3458296 RepID=UPI00403E5112
MPAPLWKLAPGEPIKRTELHAAFGGSSQNGIAPSRQSPNVFIFSDPASGEQHGYFDGWFSDGCFHYTGEGQRGDQQLKAGNAALLHHAADGRALRVFDGARGIVRYRGEFVVDATEPYYFADAPETGDGPLRQVIVFRLRPLDAAVEGASALDALLHRQVEQVAVERQMTEVAWVNPRAEGHELNRREQRLVLAYRDHLIARGHDDVGRMKIVPDGEHRPLFTDLYCRDLNLLVEAKGSAERGSIRMAIGQLADYRRFLSPSPICAVLLPSQPRPDLLALLDAEDCAAIWPAANGGFADSRNGTLS